jgi:hypothetical protein
MRAFVLLSIVMALAIAQDYGGYGGGGGGGFPIGGGGGGGGYGGIDIGRVVNAAQNVGQIVQKARSRSRSAPKAPSLPRPQPVVERAAPGECAVNKDDCEARSFRECGPKTTSAGTTCRRLFKELCTSDETFEDAAVCVAARCDKLTKVGGHSQAEMQGHCRNGDAGGAGVGGLCAERVCRRGAPAVVERAAPQGECAVNKDDCEARSFRACGPKTTSAGTTCRNVFKALCDSDETFEDAAACITRCNVDGDQWHSEDEKRNHCRNGDAGGAGVRGLCAERVCRRGAPAPQPAVEPAAPKAKSKSASKPKPAPQAQPAQPAPQAQPAQLAPQAPAAPRPAPVPCQEDRVIFVATDDDCVDRLQDEVDKLSLVVQKLKVLLLVKGVPVPEKCDSPPIFPPRNDNPPNGGSSTTTPGGNNGGGSTTTPGGNNNNGGTTTPGGNNNNNGGTTTPGGNNNGGTTTPGGGNNGGTTTPGGENRGATTTPGGNNGGTTTPGGGNNGGTTTPGGGNGHHGTTTPGGNNNNGGSTPPTGSGSKRVATTSSGGGVSSAAVVGATIGAAACAGIAAVCIGFLASGAGASAAAPASAAGMPAASVNPLYQAHTSGAENSLYGGQ